MGQPSSEASYALIYLTYGAFLSVQPMTRRTFTSSGHGHMTDFPQVFWIVYRMAPAKADKGRVPGL